MVVVTMGTWVKIEKTTAPLQIYKCAPELIGPGLAQDSSDAQHSRIFADQYMLMAVRSVSGGKRSGGKEAWVGGVDVRAARSFPIEPSP